MPPVFPAVRLKAMDSGALALAIIEKTTAINGGTSDLIIKALSAATYLHRNQTRANRAGMPRTPYSEHPLRNALRALRKGVTKLDVIAAIILHDTIEDAADSIVRDYMLRDTSTLSEAEMRETALEWMADEFGADVTRLVLAVTNPLHEGPKLHHSIANPIYASHVHDSIHGDAEVFVVKFVDFEDNACGLHHNVRGIGAGTNDRMVKRLSTKYNPLVDIFEAELAFNYGAIMALVSHEGLESIVEHIANARVRLPELMGLAA